MEITLTCSRTGPFRYGKAYFERELSSRKKINAIDLCRKLGITGIARYIGKEVIENYKTAGPLEDGASYRILNFTSENRLYKFIKSKQLIIR